MAATRVFAERGYERATTNQIADKAGVSIGSLYQYFPHKAALAAALELEHLDVVGAALIELARRMRAEQVTLAMWVTRFVRAVLAHNDEPHHATLYGVVPRMPEVQARVTALVDALAAELAPLVAGRGATVRARLAIVAAIVLVHELALHSPRRERAAILREIEAMIIGYLGPAPRRHRASSRSG
ncbi:MAG: helix-turn-helix domain-containing protein [Kofleriaceae bacterium]|nr:helix-turn-helix domain-containing protein [Kofleriaceae bacterium]